MLGVFFKRYAGYRVVGLSILLVMSAAGVAQQSQEFTITLTTTEILDAVGNAHVQSVMGFDPPRGYDRIKKIYPNLYVLFRDFGPERSIYEINKDTLKITSDDGRRFINFSGDVVGAAVCRKNHWQLVLSPNEQLSSQDGNRLSTVASSNAATAKFLEITNYILPANAQNTQIDRETHLLTYTLPVPRSPVPSPEPELDIHMRFKPHLMAAVYKVYGDSTARDGAYWVAKTIIKNTGQSAIHDLKIYYRLGDYTDLSVPETYSAILPGGAVVDAYYPVISSRVAELKTSTPLQLYVRYEYKDENGKLYSEEITRRTEMLGINQFEFSNLSDQDRTDSWFDYFNNAPLLAAFVTRLDDPVKQFAGYISEAAGGAPATSDDRSAIQWLFMAYAMELGNNIVYSTPSSFLTNDRSSGQDIKYPRDVFRDKAGTCVDLAILFAALAESVGLKANLMIVPGHAFPVIKLPSGELLAVESTELGGDDPQKAFKKAVDDGTREYNQFLQEGLYYLVNVEDQWSAQRVPNPELASLGTDFLDKHGIKRKSGLALTSARNASRQPSGQTQDKENLGSPYRVVHDHAIGTLAAYCVGTLYVSRDTLTFIPERSTDGRNDRFQVLRSDIQEAKKNRGLLGSSLQAFHIRLQNGANFNFARIDESNRGLAADDVLAALAEIGGTNRLF